MTQSVQGISELHFPEIDAYLTGIKDWQQKGLTYAAIAKDKKEYKKLSDAFVKIRRSSRFAFDVYGDLKSTIQKITSVFGTIGTDAKKLDELYQRMDQLSIEQKQLNHDFQSFVFGFVETNSAFISVDALQTRVQNLDHAGAELSSRMNDVLKFYAIGTDGSEQNVLRTMTDLLSNEVGIFEKPLKSQFIEPIRKVYQKLDQTSQLQTAYNKCLWE